MSDLEVFALIGIAAGAAAAILIPEASRVAPTSVINIFGMVLGVLVTSMGFLAFTTAWSEPGAWRSGLLLMTGVLIACYMMKRCTKRYRPSGGINSSG
jgi:hypothetical protein